MIPKEIKNIFFVGIKGVAMTNLAVLAKKVGREVSGADVAEEFITDKLLEENGIAYQVGFDPKKLPVDVDAIVYSAAHGGTANPLVKEAEKRKIKVLSQPAFLGEIIPTYKNTVAVSGCHGKTTTSSLLSYALKKLGKEPGYVVGVPYFGDYPGVDSGRHGYFVVEADEYGVNPPVDKTAKFLHLKTNWAICTNIDFDHPDVYKNIEETKSAFIKFFENKNLILNIDDENLSACLKKLNNKKIATYGFSGEADYQITNWNVFEDYSEFEIKNVGKFRISIFGRHNISNAAAVIAILKEMGFGKDETAKAIANFTGAERRFEVVYQKNDTFLFDDYAHHPAEIAATVKAARERFGLRRIVIIFQPHTFSRTNLLVKEFRQSLEMADKSFVLPIFSSARENPKNFHVSSQDIVQKISNLTYVEDNKALIENLIKYLREGDVVFTMGAGDVYKLKKEIIPIIDGLAGYGLRVQKNIDLYPFLTLKTHVVADEFIDAKSRFDIVDAKKLATSTKRPFFIFGGGSNLAVVSARIEGIVVRNDYKKLAILEEDDRSVTILVSGGYPVGLLIAKSIEAGWSGFELHQGLPGTVGGALYMNSKWTKPPTYFGDDLIYAYIIKQNGRIVRVSRAYFEFAYDYSHLQKTKEIVLEAAFRLKKVARKIIADRALEAVNYRKKTQPFGISSSGCFFQNISEKEKEVLHLPTTSAGYLIDKSGLKGFSVGNFFVSPVHANFIVNKGNGKSADLVKLLGIIKKRVLENYRVDLKEEVIII